MKPISGRRRDVRRQRRVQRVAELRLVGHHAQAARQLADLRRVRSRSISPGASDGARRVAITVRPHFVIFCSVASGMRSTPGRIRMRYGTPTFRDRPIVDEIEVVAGVQNLRDHRRADQPVHRLVHRVAARA